MRRILLVGLLAIANFAFAQERGFKVLYQGQEVTDEQVFETTQMEEDGNMHFHLTIQASQTIKIKITNEFVEQVEGSHCDMCWGGVCYGGASISLPKIKVAENLSGYGTYYPEGSKGVSKVKYTFLATNIEDSTPLTLYVIYKNGDTPQPEQLQVSYSGEILTDGQEIAITDYILSDNNEEKMSFITEVESDQTINVTIWKDDSNVLSGTTNCLYWNETEAEDNRLSVALEAGVPTVCTATYYPQGKNGVSRICYVFETPSTIDHPLTVYVSYDYDDGSGTGVISERLENSCVHITQSDKEKYFQIANSSESDCRVRIYNTVGTLLQEVIAWKGESIQSRQLPSGCYLLSILKAEERESIQKRIIR